MRVTNILLLLLIILLLSCQINQKRHSGIYSLQIERTPCMGPCPVYTILFTKEIITLNAQSNLSIEGIRYIKTTPDQWFKVKPIILSEKVWMADSIYESKPKLDLPTIILKITKPDNQKTIRVTGNPPDFILEYLKFTEEFIEKNDWKSFR